MTFNRFSGKLPLILGLYTIRYPLALDLPVVVLFTCKMLFRRRMAFLHSSANSLPNHNTPGKKDALTLLNSLRYKTWMTSQAKLTTIKLMKMRCLALVGRIGLRWYYCTRRVTHVDFVSCCGSSLWSKRNLLQACKFPSSVQ